ncbi:hypothetical protein EVAR_56550_1 [Eumeta japonica]|uniref:Uncharacterized protein n=1 Tax=Eumeta variegata TaxID=151549 RepID=A0A4C1ZVE7_EUMVA|nr:hypothetical protein EVAR_56550_1 [Eumeta japonica]
MIKNGLFRRLMRTDDPRKSSSMEGGGISGARYNNLKLERGAICTRERAQKRERTAKCTHLIESGATPRAALLFIARNFSMPLGFFILFAT